jgi:Membrane protein involved in the export of O-antigen and teichoic acid
MSMVSDSAERRQAMMSAEPVTQPLAVCRPSLFKDPQTFFVRPAQHTASYAATLPPVQTVVGPLPALSGTETALLPYCEGSAAFGEIEQQQTWRLPVWPGLQTMGGYAALSDWSVALKLLRTLLHDSGIYALVACLSPLLSLILTPLLTHTLSRADYGVLTVLNATLVFLSGLTQCGLCAAFTYAYNSDYHASPLDQQRAFATLIRLLGFGSLVIAALLYLGAAPMALLLFRDNAYTPDIRLVALLLLLQNIGMPGLTWLRLRGRVVLFALLTGLSVVCNLGLTLALVAFWHLGCAGALWSGIVAALVPIVGTAPLVVPMARSRFHLMLAYDLLAFGVSTLPGLLSVWMLQLVDRYFLLATGSLSLTASYAVAYTLGNVAAPLVIAPFALAWYSILHALARNARAQELFRQIFRYYSALLLFTACVVATGAHLLLRWWFPPTYATLAPIIPFIALSNVWYGLFDLFSVGIHVRGKIWYSVIYLPIAACLNLLLNFLLIPPYGALGAALATLLSYFALTVMAYLVNQSVYAIAFELDRFAVALVLGIACYGCTQWLAVLPLLHGPVRYILILLVLCSYAIVLLILCKLPLRRSLALAFGRVSRWWGGVR